MFQKERELHSLNPKKNNFNSCNLHCPTLNWFGKGKENDVHCPTLTQSNFIFIFTTLSLQLFLKGKGKDQLTLIQ
jgi:hypothetical protein